MSPGQQMALAIVCVAALLAIFVLLALVRMWGRRMQKQGGGCGGLDLEALRRQQDTGVISQKEYDIIVGGIAGAGSAATPRAAKAGSEEEDQPKPPITDAAGPGADPDRSGPDGQD
jgi:hypothetical protein